MPSNRTPLLLSFQTISFLPGSKIHSPNSGVGKGLRSALKTITQAPGCRSTHWSEKLPDIDSVSIVVITCWSHESNEVEFYTSEAWASALRNMKDYLLEYSLSRLTSDREKSCVKFPETHGFTGGSFLRPLGARVHEILTFKFPVNVTEEELSEFDWRVKNLRDGVFNVIGGHPVPGLKALTGGYVSSPSSKDGRESASKIFVLFLSYPDESTKKSFKNGDANWIHFLSKVSGIFEDVQGERFEGYLREVRPAEPDRYSFESETDDGE